MCRPDRSNTVAFILPSNHSTAIIRKTTMSYYSTFSKMAGLGHLVSARRGAANAQINCKNHACSLQIRAQKARRDSQPGCRMCVCRCVGRMRFVSLRNTKKRCSGCSRSSNHWSPGHPLIAAKLQSGDDFRRGKSAQQTVQVEDRNQRQSNLGLGAGHMGTRRRRSTEHASPMLLYRIH